MIITQNVKGGGIMAKVKLFLAEGFEEVEALTVIDLLRRVGIDISMVSITDCLEVIGAHHIQVRADELFIDVDFSHADMLILPGGMPGTKNLSTHNDLITLLKQYDKENKMIAAICAAPSVLGMNDILRGKKATCYPGFEEQLLGATYEDSVVVVSRNIITSKGLGTAIDFSLSIIGHLLGNEVSEELSKSIQHVRN